MSSRPAVLAALVALVVTASACAGPTGKPAWCEPPPPADVTTVPGWVGHLRAHPDDVAYVFDDGRGRVVEHRADTVQAMASASKVLTLVAYAREVALGRVDPDETVTVGDWERWSVAVANQDSHANALDALGITRDGARAVDPRRTVTLERIADQISIWSDDAGPDLLRARLGDRALLEAARDVGWADPELISNAGFLLSFTVSELVPPATDRPARRAAEWDLARRYAADPGFRAVVDARPVPTTSQRDWADGGPGGTARQLAHLWSAVGRGTFPGADRARALTEQGPSALPGVIGRGAKGGLLTGIVTRGTHVRREDGTVAVAVLLVRGLDDADTQVLSDDSEGFDDFLTAAVEDPETLRCLR